MDLITSPDIYTPSVNTDGNYIDYIPIIINGLFCPCGTRKLVEQEKIKPTKNPANLRPI